MSVLTISPPDIHRSQRAESVRVSVPNYVQLRGVSKSFGFGSHRRDVLRDVNLDMARGEFVAIVGYSGSGKTTLISLLAGLIFPDVGQVLLSNREVTGPGADRGVVFQNYSLLPWLTVYGNVELAVKQVHPDWPVEKRRDHIKRHIALVNLTAATNKRPHELSGGMRQRVSVARALAMNPEMLLLDEPLSALDALTRATLQDEIVELWERDRKTVVLITNDVDEALLVADRVIPLSAGPGATLGPSVSVNLDRPRDRKTLVRDPAFKHLRRRVLDYLLGEGRRGSR